MRCGVYVPEDGTDDYRFISTAEVIFDVEREARNDPDGVAAEALAWHRADVDVAVLDIRDMIKAWLDAQKE